MGLDEGAIARGDIVDSGGEAQKAGDTIREHRRGIAETGVGAERVPRLRHRLPDRIIELRRDLV